MHQNEKCKMGRPWVPSLPEQEKNLLSIRNQNYQILSKLCWLLTTSQTFDLQQCENYFFFSSSLKIKAKENQKPLAQTGVSSAPVIIMYFSPTPTLLLSHHVFCFSRCLMFKNTVGRTFQFKGNFLYCICYYHKLLYF